MREMVEQVADAGGVGTETEVAVAVTGFAVAEQVDGDHGAAGVQQAPEDFGPGLGRGSDAVDEEQRGAGALVELVGEVVAVECGGASRHDVLLTYASVTYGRRR
jgi:hypothetical protein